MDSYDTSAEYLRTRVQKVADEISQHLQKTPAGEQFFFICDIVNAVENAVGDVVHVAQDGVNAAVNVTHNIVTAVENIGERAIHATENAVNAVSRPSSNRWPGKNRPAASGIKSKWNQNKTMTNGIDRKTVT